MLARLIESARDWRATGSLRETYELARLSRLPRRRPARASLLGRELEAVDGASFVAMYREIFGRELYRFEAARPDPFVLDAGANIGLSVLYFKRLYPLARVRAFEADPAVFLSLQRNVAHLEGVELDPRAVWTCDGSIRFHPEGADAGRIRPVERSAGLEVPCTRLRDHLNERIDLLKMDIEGAEVDVLADSAGRLDAVERIFVEYHSFTGDRQRLPELTDILRSAGFRLWMESVGHARHPLAVRPQYLGMDLQLNIFGTRT